MGIPATADVPALDFGTQGGDAGRGVDIDLSTCVNRYGPPPAALSALHTIQPEDILLHPHDAAPRLVELYRGATGVPHGAMIAGRGASEFIWAMGRELTLSSVQVPLPAYTDYLEAFPGRGFNPAGQRTPTLDQIDAAMNAAGVVIISNPHNPTGAYLDPDGLIDIAGRHPAATLVVDESYIDFTPEPVGWSVIGCDVPNIVVLRSTTKFYGIAATRTGIAWCAESGPLAYLFGRQENWGLSGVDVRVACAAVRSFAWSEHTRVQLHADNAWLAENLSRITGFDLFANQNVHFQYASCKRAHEVAGVFHRHGIGVRVLGAAHGVVPDALRIMAPRRDERARFAAAVTDVIDGRVAG